MVDSMLLGRRDFLRGAAASGVGLMAAACAGPGASSPLVSQQATTPEATEVASGPSSPPAPGLTKLRVFGPEVAGVDDWSDFKQSTGMDIEWTGFQTDVTGFIQEVVVNDAGSKYDLFVFDGGIEDKLASEGLILPVDEAALSNWGGIPDTVKRAPFYQTPDGTQYGIPLVYNADSFAYYVDDLQLDEPVSYSVLFDDERTKGKVALEDSWLSTLPMAASYLAFNGRAQIADPGNMTAEEAKGVVDFLIERKKAGQFRSLWAAFDESVDLMARKEVIASNIWEPAVKELQRQGKNVRYAVTKEGYNKWGVAIYIPSQIETRGTNVDVYRAIDWFLSGYYGGRIAVLRGYAAGRPDLALEYAKTHGWPQDEIDAIELNIEKVDTKYQAKFFWQSTTPDHLDDISSEWERFRQA